jgi:hypothetical protein
LLLEKHLWPKGCARDVWMILDTARDNRSFGVLLESYLENSCLYAGYVPRALEAAAPYLLRLEYEDRRTRRLLERAWGNSWGVFLKCDTRLESLRRHLRQFLTVRDPSGKRVLFRYYDPRVLRVYLPTCTGEELRALFGPIEAFWIEGENPQNISRYGFDGSRLVLNRLSLETSGRPQSPTSGASVLTHTRQRPGMLAIRREQWSIFSQTEVQKFEDWMVSHLQKFFPGNCRRMGEANLRQSIQHGIHRAGTYGITAKRDVCKYIDVMIVLGQDFDKDERIAWAARILQQQSGSRVKAQMLLQRAVTYLKQQAAVPQHG